MVAGVKTMVAEGKIMAESVRKTVEVATIMGVSAEIIVKAKEWFLDENVIEI